MVRVKYTSLTSNALRALVLAVVLQTAYSVQPAQVAHVGGQCDGHTVLCPPSADCRNTVCHCVDGFVPAVDNSNCLKVATNWHDHCSSNTQCENLVGAVCRDNQCQCELGHHVLDEQCWVTKHLNDNCVHNEECVLQTNPDRVECNGGFCKCKHPFHENPSGDQCNGCNAVWSLGLTSLLLTAVIQKLLH